jgi:hypothetical protein
MKTILLLGAGASIPFYSPRLSTQHITAVISDPDRWNDLVARYTAIMGSNTNMVDVSVVLNSLNLILATHPDYNFEQIIEIFDKVSSFNFHPIPNSKIFHDILILYKAVAPHIPNHTWDCVPFLFRQLITEEIESLHSKGRVPSYSTLSAQQEQFVDTISSGDECNIFTLNYDELILESIQNLGFVTGFNTMGRFNVNAFLQGSKTISFPHGHSRFSYDEDGILYHINCAVANTYRLNNIARHDRTQTKYLTESAYCYSFNTFISTGQQKEPTFDVNPYATYYQKFAFDCLTANRIIIVGYSFSDPHFNRMMTNFRQLNPANKIYVVDFAGNSIDVFNEFMKQGSLINKIFTMLSSTPDLDMHGKYLYLNEQASLNTNGFGEIHPNIFIFRNGYDGFLNTFHTLGI